MGIPMLVLMLVVVPTGTHVYAQTGPGGVGTTDGGSALELWLRGDQGVFSDTGCSASASGGNDVACWTDLSGHDNDATDATSGTSDDRPVFSASGGPASTPSLLFDPDASGKDTDQLLDGMLSKSDAVTLMAVYSHSGGTISDGTVLELHDGGSPTSGTRNIVQARVGDQTLAYFANGNTRTGGTFTGGEVVIHGTTHEGTEAEMFKNGASVFQSSSENANLSSSNYRIGNDNTNGNTIDGVVSEVLVFSRVLNAAERTIVENYLSSRYGISLSGAGSDKFAHDTAYGVDVAGIGRASSSETHLSSSSSLFTIETASFSGDGDYIFLGHNGAGATSFGFESTEPVNELSSNVERMAREWRVDFSSISGSQTVTFTVNGSDLPAKQSGYDYMLFVDSNGGFQSPASYTLQDSGGGACTQSSVTCEVDVALEDDDYVTLGAGQRVVTFSTSSRDAFENTTASGTAQLNLPFPTSSGTSTNVFFSSTGDVDSSGSIEDGGVTNAAGTNNNGNFEADDGSGNDTAGGTPDGGTFDGDFRINAGTTSPVTIPAGDSTATIDFDLDDDGIAEQTERFSVTLNGTNLGEVSVGSTSTLTVSINDDDEPRTLSFATPNPADEAEGNGGGTRTATFTVEMPGSQEAAENDPFTTVDFVIADSSTVTVGDDVTIINESDPGGTAEYQERLSTTTGRIHFDRSAGTSSATVKLEVSEDAVNENDEILYVGLFNPVSSALESTGTLLTLTLTNDDSPPDVQFASASSGGSESETGSIEVTLSAAAGNTATVDFALDTETATDPEQTTATQGDDFTLSPSGGTITFDPGETSQFITINVTDDSDQELEEEVVLDLSNATNATLQTPDSHTYTINDNDISEIGDTGPGGVGSTGGSSSLLLWLNADAISGQNDNTALSTWADGSGSGNNATVQSGNSPTYRTTTGPNGGAEVQFDADNSEFMNGALSKDGPITLFGVYSHTNDGSGAPGTVLELHGETRNILQARPQENDLAYFDGATTRQGGTYSNDEDVIHGATHVGTQVDIFKNGNVLLSESSASSVGATTDYVLGDDNTGGNEIEGAVSEVIVFSSVLDSTPRILIENYLSAKYDIPLSGTDVYVGDTNANGDYDFGVFGIGRTSSTDFHLTAETDGLRFDNVASLSDNDYLVAGYAVESNSVNTSDVGGVGGLDARMERTWFVDVTGSTPTVDVTISLSDAGLSGPAGVAGDYVLLTRDPTTTNWSSVATASSIENGDELVFTGVSLTDTHEITLGTTRDGRSPLDTDNLVIRGTAGFDGEDQGWRYLGLPTESGTAGDLLADDGSVFIDFNNEWMAYTNPGGDASGNGWTAVQNTSTALPAGRGFILWFYDDIFYPIDPTITLQTSSGLSAPGASDIVIGDGTPTADASLDQADMLFLLSNPYAVPYDLSSLSGSGFDDAVQIWDADVTDGGNDPVGLDDATVGSFVTRSRSGSDLVASWQGFLLSRTTQNSGDTQATFGKAGRSGGSSVGFVGSDAVAETPTQHRIPLVLKGRNSDDQVIAVDRAASVLFRNDATLERDRFDAPKFEPMASEYATLAPVASDNTTLRARESRPIPDAAVDVPLDFRTVGVSGTFSIAVPEEGTASTETPAIPAGWDVWLIDTQGTADPDDDVTHPFEPGGSAYTFDVAQPTMAARTTPHSESGDVAPPQLQTLSLSNQSDAAIETDDAPLTRFVLRVQPDDTIPVELADLRATTSADERVRLEWQTASETNNAGFHIEHQRLAIGDTTTVPTASGWERLGFVEGTGTTTKPQTYRFQTESLDYGRHLFRLRQVDTDGTMTTTAPIETTIELQQAFALDAPYPNPARQQVTLPLTVRETQPVRVEVFDVLGRRVTTVHDGEVQGQSTRRFTLSVHDLSSGIYFVRVRGDQFATTRRLTVVR